MELLMNLKDPYDDPPHAQSAPGAILRVKVRAHPSYYPRYTPFMHHLYTYVHPVYMCIHHTYTY